MGTTQREIKFRAFHKPTGQMFWFDVMNGADHGTGSGYIPMAPFGEPITKNSYKDNLRAVDPMDCDLMQFTGLLDKNGKEIWEGDILQCYYGGAKHGAMEVVEFKNGAFILRHRTTPISTYLEFDGTYTTDLEVIGNIYESESTQKVKEK